MAPSAFEKRIKRRIIGPEHDFFVVCIPGLEGSCERELKHLFPDNPTIEAIPGGVMFRARLHDCYLANLYLRCASRILMRITTFRAERFSEFERQAQQVDWELYLPRSMTPDCRVSVQKCRLYHSSALAQRMNDTLSTRFDTPMGPDPEANKVSVRKSVPQTVYVRGEHDRFTLSLDTSGVHLYQRGLKQAAVAAPIRETIAAAMLDWAGFTPDDVLLDPMCGSGTFSLEAGMIKSRVPAGFLRGFSFESWPAFKPAQFNHLKKKAAEHFVSAEHPSIFASDIDRDAVQRLKKNITGAHALAKISFARHFSVIQNDFFSLVPEHFTATPGVITLNPPYDKRIKAGTSPRKFYEHLGKKLKSDFRHWRVATVIPSKSLAKSLGIPLTLKPIVHGGLDLYVGHGTIR